MTNEDAIKILKEHCYVFNPLDFDKTTMINTALDMAVKTLRQEPQKPEVAQRWKARTRNDTTNDF